MRIGLITPGFSASEEDWCIPALLDLVRTLAEHDEVTVFSLRYPHHQQAYRVHGASVVPTGGAERGGLARVPILLQTLGRILREARRRPFDVFQALWAHEPGFLAALAGRLTKTPVVVSILGGELADLPQIDYGGGRSRANRWLVARALAGADRVTVGSAWLEQQVARRITAGLHQQPLGFEPARFHPSAGTNGDPPAVRLEGEPILLHVASLSQVKDHETLLRAFALVTRHHPDARLHLVGEGVDAEAIAPWLGRLEVSDRVEIHGRVDHGQLPGFYQQADLLLQSSRFESQGMAVLEAAACGCPVVGTGVGILPQLCLPELLSTPGDASALAANADAVLADRERRERLLAKQVALVRRFELPMTAKSLRQLFCDLIATGDRALSSEATG
ncbi:MAG: glycosyltransferase [Acidobacteriota bacterium]